jgi:glutamate-ammonia-ligase adenylyltransferase
MGHLDREDAEFMREAATFYRAIDHGMRVSTGHADGSLPTSPTQRAVLCELVSRWSPERLRQCAGETLLQSTLTQMRVRTRTLFDRIFS